MQSKYPSFECGVHPWAGTCPVPEAQRRGALDPRNNMPLEPNQRAAPGQLKAISTSRLQSSIPKGGTDTTWVYPSPQMFYNGVPLRVNNLSRLAVVCNG